MKVISHRISKTYGKTLTQPDQWIIIDLFPHFFYQITERWLQRGAHTIQQKCIFMKASKSWKLPFTAIFHYLKVAMYSCFLPLIEITRYSSRRCMEVKAAKAFFTNTATACHRYLFLGYLLFEMCRNYLVVLLRWGLVSSVAFHASIVVRVETNIE